MKNWKIHEEETLDCLAKGVYDPRALKSALNFRGAGQEKLFALARKKRDAEFPAREIELRSVVEIANKCRQKCNYCSIGRKNAKEYALGAPEITALAGRVYANGRRTLLIQSGENDEPRYVGMVARSLEKIKDRFPDLVLILCLGNLRKEQYLQLRRTGAERYILKFETSNPAVFRKTKPNDTLRNRLECLDNILAAGFSAGSGNIVGLPGQTAEDLVNDLLLLRKYDLSMNSASVFIPSEDSKYGNEPLGNVETTLNAMALMRIMNPGRLMPATSSLEKAGKGAQLRGLMAGANTLTVHDGTPNDLKPFFSIYSAKRVTPQAGHMKNLLGKARMKLPKGLSL